MPEDGTRIAVRLAMAFGVLAIVAWGFTNWAGVHAANLPGPTLSDCGRVGERTEICTDDQLRWEDRIDVMVAVAVALTALAVIAAVSAIGIKLATLAGRHRNDRA